MPQDDNSLTARAGDKLNLQKKQPTKILVLTSSTGGGHDMRAFALKSWAESRHARELNIDVVVHRTLEATHGLYRFGVWLYNFVQRKFPGLHHIYFRYLEWAAHMKHRSRILGANGFQEIVREVQPDIVLSTHPHLNHGFLELARDAGCRKPPKCVTYCGELFDGYGFSRHWVNPQIDLFIGAVEEVCRGARSYGLPAARVWRGGYLLKPQFYRDVLSAGERRAFLKENFRLDPDRFTLVLATGANGANNHLRFLRALHRKKVHPQVIALCGRNPKIQMQVLRWAARHPESVVRAVGYYQDMNHLLQAADAVVARPGTGTTSEAILSGCPVIFNTIGYAMPQEMITIRYFKEHNWPSPVGRAGSLPDRVAYWMNHRDHLKHARAVMETMSPDEDPMEILRRLKSLVGEDSPLPRVVISHDT